MSNWRCLLYDMAAAGGDSLQLSSMPGWGVTSTTQRGRRDLIVHGFIKPVGARRHSITPKGWRVASGAADMVERKMAGKIGHLPRTYSLVVRGLVVPDEVIEDLLIESGLMPGAPISAEIIRVYSAKLAAVVRSSL